MFPIPFNFPFIKKNGERTTIGDAINAGGGGYTLPTASAETKGGVKIGSGLTMTGEVLSNTNPTPYSLPTASDEILGGVKVGSGLSIVDGVLSVTGGSGGGGFHLYRFSSSNTNFSSGYVISNHDDGSTAGTAQSNKTTFKTILYNGIGFMTANALSAPNTNLGIITINSDTAAYANVIKDAFTISDNSVVITKSTANPEFSYMNNFSYTKVF